MNIYLLLTIAVLISANAPVKAQAVAKEMQAFVKKFETAYNNKDDKSLKTMYTEDAVRIAADGSTATGNEAIVNDLKSFFTTAKLTIAIKQDSAQSQADGSVTTSGTYHITGTTDAGEKIDINGGYTNTCVKVKGQWKIAKSVIVDK